MKLPSPWVFLGVPAPQVWIYVETKHYIKGRSDLVRAWKPVMHKKQLEWEKENVGRESSK